MNKDFNEYLENSKISRSMGYDYIKFKTNIQQKLPQIKWNMENICTKYNKFKIIII